MSSVHADIDALRDFHGALVRFRSAQRELAERVDAEIELARLSLEESAGRWRSRVERSRAELDDCRDRGAADRSARELAVAESEAGLERVQQLRYLIDAQVSEFRGVAGGFRDQLEVDLPHAEAELLAAIASLRDARETA